MNNQTLDIIVPFAGFYDSVNSSAFENCLESIHEHFEEVITDSDLSERNKKRLSALLMGLYNNFSYTKEMLEKYCSEYVDFLAEEAEIPSLTFKSLYRPREYNFRTDQITASLDISDAKKLLDRLDREQFAAYIKECNTARSGFTPYYTNDITEYLSKDDITDYDAIELGQILESVLLSGCVYYSLGDLDLAFYNDTSDNEIEEFIYLNKNFYDYYNKLHDLINKHCE